MEQRDQGVAKGDLDESEDDIDWEDVTDLTLAGFDLEPDTLPSFPPSFAKKTVEQSVGQPAKNTREDGTRRQSRHDEVALPFPRQLASYEVLIPIGSGATATVFLARIPVLGGSWRYVALKLIHAHVLLDNPVLRHRVVREVKLAGWLRHANVVSFIDVGEEPQGVFFVMDYVEGDTLSSLMPWLADGRQRLPIPIAMRIILDLLQGLDAIHSLRGDNGRPLAVVHRDVAPQNILVGTQGVARLIDLGAAKVPSWTQVTQRRSVLGRVPYLAPEQVAGANVDRRCDVWAAGVVIWELLAGRRLFPDSSLRSLVKRMQVTPPGLRSIRKDVPTDLARAIASALMLNVKDRCPTAKELHARVRDAWLPSGTIAEPAEVGALVRKIVEPKLKEREKAVMELLRYRRALSDLTQTAMRELVEEDRTTTSHLRL